MNTIKYTNSCEIYLSYKEEYIHIKNESNLTKLFLSASDLQN